MRRVTRLLVGSTVVVLVCASARAIDHSNLDEERPLRIEDAYSITRGEWALETGVGYSNQRRGSDRFLFPVEVLYGAYDNLHVSIGSTLFTEPREVEGPRKSGDLHVSALYNFNQETLRLPAFGLKGTVNLPTGVRSRGVDGEIKGLVTKSFGNLSLHLNPAYEFISGREPGERSGRYKVALGPSYPIGAPKYTRTTLVGDVFTEQSLQRGESNTFGVEAGFRHQLTQRIVVDFGVGSEFSGPSKRSPFFAMTGVSFAF